MSRARRRPWRCKFRKFNLVVDKLWFECFRNSRIGLVATRSGSCSLCYVACTSWRPTKSLYKLKEWLAKRNFAEGIFSYCEPKDKEDFVKTSSARNGELLKVRKTKLCSWKTLQKIVLKLLTDGHVDVSEELKDLYSIYQQEIHASTYTSGAPRTQSKIVYDTKLPPIYNRTWIIESIFVRCVNNSTLYFQT